jgi:hypothetical protein
MIFWLAKGDWNTDDTDGTDNHRFISHSHFQVPMAIGIGTTDPVTPEFIPGILRTKLKKTDPNMVYLQKQEQSEAYKTFVGQRRVEHH